MLRVMVAIGTDEWVFGFPQNEVVIGAARASALVLDHATVAAKHARFVVDRENVFVESLDQSKPLRVNNRDIGRMIVREGDVIDIGAYRLGVLERDLPTSVEKDFLDAIANAPHDDEPRAVYSDWLEENGRLEDAEFLRAQIEVRRLTPENQRFIELSRTITTLAARMPLPWRRAVARPAIENCGVQFEVECPKTWDSLATTKEPDQRWCNACERKVHYATDIATARRLAISGQCVSLDLLVRRHPNDLQPQPPPIRMGGMIMPLVRPPAK